MKKKFAAVMVTAVATLAMSVPAFAGQWLSNANGWWWVNDDGSYPSNSWQWLDGNGDGVSECYYFDANGYCLINTTTPDGYMVDGSGAWIVNGSVQTQGGSTSAQTATEETQAVSNVAAVNLLDLEPVSRAGSYAGTNEKTSRDELWSKALVFNSFSNSHAEYYTGGQYNQLFFTMAPGSTFSTKYGTTVEVYGDDDEQLWESDEITYKSKAEDVTIDITGHEYVKIFVNWSGANTGTVLFKNAQFR
ncbi:MAG: NPCBM/NEW2 domain-containing protein [Clostridiales bacterium]|nr:NPCBM/NEW2 domain-containing protein [Clostridiales bacterium]